MRKNVAIGMLGTTKDAGRPDSRWNRWRPSIALCQQDDLPLARFELLHDSRHENIAQMVATDIKIVSPNTLVNLHCVDNKDPWNFEEVYGSLYDFAKDYQFDDSEEDYFLHLTTGTHVAQICWFLLAEARFFPAKLVQTAPPRDRRSDDKSGQIDIIDLDISSFSAIQSRFDVETAKATTFLKGGIDTRNPKFNVLIEQIEKVAIASQAPVLLQGAQGTGKTELAKRLFQLKQRRHNVRGHFVHVNCSTIRGEMGMAALFGQRRGFSGATVDRKGLLREADRGVLFLDEIDELGLDEQAMILHAVETGRFFPMGSDHEVESKFQLVAGSNRDLAKLVQKQLFRGDLYSRLNLWTFKLPSLCERREDIEPNIEYELAQSEKTLGQRVAFNLDALEKYIKFAKSPSAGWIGNFRDLSASIMRMCTLAPRGRISINMVDEEIERLLKLWSASPVNEIFKAVDELIEKPIDEFDRFQLANVLSVCKQSSSLSEAGRKLYAVSREGKAQPNDADRLRKYLAKFGLNWPTVSNE